MIRTLMPHHDSAIKSGRLALLPSEHVLEPLTATETSQSLGSKIGSMIIAPVAADGLTRTIITVGRLSGPSARSFTRSEVLLVRAAADCLSAFSVESGAGRVIELKRTQLETRAEYPAMELRSRLKSSLSGIIGSVELMKAQGEPSAPTVNRYLSIIDKSAQRMHQYLDAAEPMEVVEQR